MYKKTVLNFYILFFTLFTISFKSSFAMISKVSKEVTARIFCFSLNPEELGEKYRQKDDYGKKLFNRLLELELVSKYFLSSANYYKENYLLGKDKTLKKMTQSEKLLYKLYLHPMVLKELYKIIDTEIKYEDMEKSCDEKTAYPYFFAAKVNPSYLEQLKSKTKNSTVFLLAGKFGFSSLLNLERENSFNKATLPLTITNLQTTIVGASFIGNIECLKYCIAKLKKALIEKLKKSFHRSPSLEENTLEKILNTYNLNYSSFSFDKTAGTAFVYAAENGNKEVLQILKTELDNIIQNKDILTGLFGAAHNGLVEIVKKIIEKYGDPSIYSKEEIESLERSCKKSKNKKQLECLRLIRSDFLKDRPIYHRQLYLCCFYF